MKKKVLLIIIPIVLVFLIIGIIGAIFVGMWLNKNKTVGTTWGDTYYAYLKEAINDKNLGDAEEKYGMQLGMKDAKIGFCDINKDSIKNIMFKGQNPTDEEIEQVLEQFEGSINPKLFVIELIK